MNKGNGVPPSLLATERVTIKGTLEVKAKKKINLEDYISQRCIQFSVWGQVPPDSIKNNDKRKF